VGETKLGKESRVIKTALEEECKQGHVYHIN
jgi:hypothetical protein